MLWNHKTWQWVGISPSYTMSSLKNLPGLGRVKIGNGSKQLLAETWALTSCHLPSQYLQNSRALSRIQSLLWTTIVWYGYQPKHQHGNQGNRSACGFDSTGKSSSRSRYPCDKIDLKNRYRNFCIDFLASLVSYLKYQWCLRLAKIALLVIVMMTSLMRSARIKGATTKANAFGDRYAWPA